LAHANAHYVASITKTITATALMILKERQQLDLDRAATSI
jgi:CubicO group peptidase (beta-lactamase class C family)